MAHLPVYVPGNAKLTPVQPRLKPGAVFKPLATMIAHPIRCWSEFREDGRKFQKIIEEQVFCLALFPPFMGFIGYSVVGNGDAIVGLKRAFLGYVASLLFIYGAALFAHKTAEALCGKDSIDQSGKLVVYSLIPFFISSIFLIHPVLAPLVMFGAYGVYQFTQGVKLMTDIPASQYLLYCAINIIAWLFVLDRLLIALFRS